MGKKNLTGLAKKTSSTTKKTGTTTKSSTPAKRGRPKKETPKSEDVVLKKTNDVVEVKNKETKVEDKIVSNKTNEMIELIESKKEEAKNKVNELLYGTDISDSIKDEIIELDNKKVKEMEWLIETNKQLTDEVERLDKELKNSGGNDQLKNQIIRVFEEIQNNYLKMGVNSFGESNLRIAPASFMNRLIMFFPFLGEYKRFADR